MAQSENVDRAAAAAGLAKEIEVMITQGAPKRAGNMKSREIKPSPRRIFPQDEQGEPYRHTKLDRAVVAAVQAVNKLKTIHSVSNLPHDEGHPKPAPQKRRPQSAKDFHKDTAGDGFYDQMHQVYLHFYIICTVLHIIQTLCDCGVSMPQGSGADGQESMYYLLCPLYLLFLCVRDF